MLRGRGYSPFVWPTFTLGFMIVVGSGFAEWCTLWLIINSWRENHENGFLFSVYVFVRRRRSSVIILAGVLVIGAVDLLWFWIPSFGLVGLGFWCSRVQESLRDIGYGSRVPPIYRYSWSIRESFFFLFYICPISSIRIVLAVEVGLRDGSDWISVLIMNPSWNTEIGSSSTGYLSSYGLRFMMTCRNSLCKVYL